MQILVKFSMQFQKLMVIDVLDRHLPRLLWRALFVHLFCVLAGVALAGSLIYGMRSMFHGKASGQGRGMGMRVGFQGLAVAALVGLMIYNKEGEKK